MLFSLALAATASLVMQQAPVAPPPQSAPTQLEEVEVTSAARRNMAREFVGRVAAPARGRGLGKWKTVCPVVANLDPVPARMIANRIVDVAQELDIHVGDADCQANIVIVFTSDAAAVTRAMVEANPRVFQAGVGALSRGGAALRAYQASEAPVRWWHLSVPIDSETGQRAVRVPGDASGAKVSAQVGAAIGCLMDDCGIGAAPIIASTNASRRYSQVVDQIYKAIIVVDMNQVSGLDTSQISDYLTFVALAQIEPEAETGPFNTVLNLFSDRTGILGLTAWDESYLRALYEAPNLRRDPEAQATAVASIMDRDASRND